MDTKFTSGPWVASLGESAFIDNGHIIEGGGMQIAHVEDWGDDDPEQAEANAKLIAAAPDLLNALHAAVELIERLSSDYATVAGKHANITQGEYKPIELAIRKATE